MSIIFFIAYIGINCITQASGILGGHDIRIHDAPYHVNYGDVCGGVLVHQLWALTCAHCGIGSSHRLKGLRVQVQHHFVHPKYGSEHKFDYDVQLLRTHRKIHFYDKVSAAVISKGDFGRNIVVSGWGYPKEKGDYNEILQQVSLNIIPINKCQEVDNVWYNHTLTDRLFCAGGFGKDACQGDSGGAAISKSQLIGLSTFGFGCGRNIPGVYTNLTETNIKLWLQHYTGLP